MKKFIIHLVVVFVLCMVVLSIGYGSGWLMTIYLNYVIGFGLGILSTVVLAFCPIAFLVALAVAIKIYNAN